MQGVKIVTMRGETYVFSARQYTTPVEVEIVSEDLFRVRRGMYVLGMFPGRNVEAVLLITDIDGEVAS